MRTILFLFIAGLISAQTSPNLKFTYDSVKSTDYLMIGTELWHGYPQDDTETIITKFVALKVFEPSIQQVKTFDTLQHGISKYKCKEKYLIQFYDKKGNYAFLTFDTIHNMTIKGDQNALIRALLNTILTQYQINARDSREKYSKIDEMYKRLEELGQATMLFYNGIQSAYFKEASNNKAVPRFEKAMKDNGYTFTKSKK